MATRRGSMLWPNAIGTTARVVKTLRCHSRGQRTSRWCLNHLRVEKYHEHAKRAASVRLQLLGQPQTANSSGPSQRRTIPGPNDIQLWQPAVSLTHVLDAEMAWRFICEQRLDMFEPPAPAPLEVLRQQWRDEKAAMRRYLASLYDADLDRGVTYPIDDSAMRARARCGTFLFMWSTTARNIAARLQPCLPVTVVRRVTSTSRYF